MSFNVGDFGKAFSFVGSFSFIPGAAAFAVIGAGLMAIDPTGGEDPSEQVLNPFSGPHPHKRHRPFWGMPMLKGDREAKLFALGWANSKEGHEPRHYESLGGYPGDPTGPLLKVLARRRWRLHLMRDHWVLLPMHVNKLDPDLLTHVDALWKEGEPFRAVWFAKSQETDHFKKARAAFWGPEIDSRAHIIELSNAIRALMEERRNPAAKSGWKRPRFMYDGGPSYELTEKQAPAIWREIALQDYLGERVASGQRMEWVTANGPRDFDDAHPAKEWTNRAKKELAEYLELETEWEAWRLQVDQALAMEKAKAEIIAAWEAAWASGEIPPPPPGLSSGPYPFGTNPPPTYPIEHVSSVGSKPLDATVQNVSIGTDVASRVILRDDDAPATDDGAILALAAGLVGLLLLA